MKQDFTFFGEEDLNSDLIVLSTLRYKEILSQFSSKVQEREAVYDMFEIGDVPVVTGTYGASRMFDTLVRAGEKGADRIWFVGLCHAIDGCYPPGSILFPEVVYGRDGVSNYDKSRKFKQNSKIGRKLKELLQAEPVKNVSVPTVTDWPDSVQEQVEELDTDTLELELASALRASQDLNVDIGAILVVSDPYGNMEDEEASQKTEESVRECLESLVDYLK